MERKQNLRETVYAALRQRMQEGQITYADRLVDYEIADQMGVSRMPVREALLQLKNEGYLEGTARGFMLRRFSPIDIAQIFDIRLLLEPEAAVLACREVTMQGLGDMEVACHEGARAHEAEDPVGFMHAGWHFRQAWVTMGTNPHLIQTIGRLREFADLARLQALGDAAFRHATLARMRGILDAFVHRDVALVRQRIEENLRQCGKAYYACQVRLLAQFPGKATSQNQG